MNKFAGPKPGVRPIRHLRWWIIALVMVGTAVNYLARSALGSAAPTLTKELSMSTQAYSYVVAAFQLAYTVVQPWVNNYNYSGPTEGEKTTARLWINRT